MDQNLIPLHVSLRAQNRQHVATQDRQRNFSAALVIAGGRVSVIEGRMKVLQAYMKMEDVTVLSRVKDTACHILINTFIWGHFSSGCCTATETLRLRGDGDLNSLGRFFSLHSLAVCAMTGMCVYFDSVCLCDFIPERKEMFYC